MSAVVVEVDGTPRVVDLECVIIAGYTGRDRESVEAHIRELAEEGVAPPAQVPMFWPLPPWLASQEPDVVVTGAGSSGEAEPCLVLDGDDMLLTLASDHTDRVAEALDVGLSKQLCPKPVAASAWRLADVVDHLDQLHLRSWIVEDGDEVLYQDGTLEALVPITDLVASLPFPRPDRCLVLGGTVPAIGGIRPSCSFRAELVDPVTGSTLDLAYTVRALEAVS